MERYSTLIQIITLVIAKAALHKSDSVRIKLQPVFPMSLVSPVFHFPPVAKSLSYILHLLPKLPLQSHTSLLSLLFLQSRVISDHEGDADVSEGYVSVTGGHVHGSGGDYEHCCIALKSIFLTALYLASILVHCLSAFCLFIIYIFCFDLI